MLIVDRPYLAACFDVSERSISNYAKDGMPGHVGHGKYELAPAVQWFIERSRAKRDETPERTTERVELLRAQKEHVDLIVQQERARLVPSELAARAFAAMQSAAAAGLDMLLDDELARQLAALDDPMKIEALVFARCRAARQSIAARVAEAAAELLAEAAED